MKKRVELPLAEPLYSTYHGQGIATAVIENNKSLRNWHLNQTMNLTCNRKFLHGYTSPQVNVVDSGWNNNSHFIKVLISTQFTKGYINPIVRELLDKGFYVTFEGVDDYYVKGKSWYRERHFNHDGLICGYDQNDKTYCIYAYDSNWVYRKFWVSQKDFNAGRVSMIKRGTFGTFCGLKVKDDKYNFSPKIATDKIKEYLDSNLEKYPFEEDGEVYGIVVHKYIAEYLTKLYEREIPYERMDRRVFRLIWEHKKVMLERIEKIEENLLLNNEISKKYKPLVSEADTMRMLYASHHMKRRDSLLPIIKNKLLKLMDDEKKLLTALVNEAERKLENEAVEVS